MTRRPISCFIIARNEAVNMAACLESVRFADERIAPHALKWDEEKHFPVDVIREAAGLGMGDTLSNPNQTVRGNGNIAIGSDSQTVGESNPLFTQAIGGNTVAIGTATHAGNTNAIAIGAHAEAEQDRSLHRPPGSEAFCRRQYRGRVPV